MESQPLAYNTSDQLPPNSTAEPILILLLNFLFAGLGHLVLGQSGKGITYIVINFLLFFLIVLLSFVFIGICILPLQIVWWVMVMVDGYVIAQRLKEGKAVRKGECAFSITKFGVSLFESSEVFVQ
ncbi:predicted protein [Naegleria gruberi]|uniref:Predicted protein n=1 Tax=Naegleria gruberi TaxID=5762 RepID=D2VPQ2_NAEGR|nr:uncharacterized protein NAEGRDRAFT_70944 [Naegleria gruberi]EFC41169.1 predicted protein [Naegleria gruberi]|eukprot:XP_002673913.1 predicted protein [Naegleria gruberi strain NEG-M]